MLDLVTLGESMLRLSSPASVRLEQANVLRVDVAGAESNLAIALSRLGLRTGWVSSLTENPLGRMIANKIREHGVDTSRLLWTDEARVGVYYLELGHAPRPNQVVYDRAYSAVSRIDIDAVDWAYIANARVLHLTGITPGLSPNCEALARRALSVATQAGQFVSFDLNYRAKIWAPEAAAKVLDDLLPRVNVLICSHDEAHQIYGLNAGAEQTAAALRDRFGLGLAVVSDGERGAVAYDGTFHHHEPYEVETVDRVGAGDAFAAGFLYGYFFDCQPPGQPALAPHKPAGTVERGLAVAMALAALKRTYRGDISWSTRDDVLDLIRGQNPAWR